MNNREENKVKIRAYRTRPTAKLPSRGHDTDAGMDLFFCPEDEKAIALEPSMSCLLQTGLKIEVPVNHMLEIKNKSSIAAKKQLTVGACVVDSGYSGEIFVNLHNIGFQIQILEPGQKIAQAVLIPVVIPLIEEVLEDRIYDKDTHRGSGALGSTGNY